MGQLELNNGKHLYVKGDKVLIINPNAVGEHGTVMVPDRKMEDWVKKEIDDAGGVKPPSSDGPGDK
jgi:hypothetical protein